MTSRLGWSEHACLCICSLVAFLSLGTPTFSPDQTPAAAAKQGKQLVNFVDVARKAGLIAQNTFGGVDSKKYIIETTGTGVAIFDYDNDGWPDIFIVNGTTLEQLPS